MRLIEYFKMRTATPNALSCQPQTNKTVRAAMMGDRSVMVMIEETDC
jgi:hypothetical protein